MIKLNLIKQIHQLKPERPIYVIGAAIMDMVMHLPKLPTSGDDIGLTEQGRHLGGCAFNIALMLKRFGIDAFNLLPVGQGSCSMEIQKLLNKHQMTTLLDNLDGDNG